MRVQEQPEASDHGGPPAPQPPSPPSTRKAPASAPDCRSPTHSRSRTLSSSGSVPDELAAADAAEGDAEAEDEVASLHRALAESREEAQLAARIGQTLLERNQQMDAEIERQDIALSVRAEQAEHEARDLEKKLARAHMQLRLLEIARAQAADQAEALMDELDRSRLRTQALQGELARTREEFRAVLAARHAADEANERLRSELAGLRTASARAEEDAAKRKRQANAAASAERERVARLEDETAALRRQLRAVERSEGELRTRHKELQAALTAQQAEGRDAQARAAQLDETVERLSTELDDVKDALRQEQLCATQLISRTRELEAQLNSGPEPHGDGATSPLSSRRLRSGSLFYELSRELSAGVQPLGSASDTAASSTKACGDHRKAGTSLWTTDKRACEGCGADSEAAAGPPTACASEHNLLKEFFMLTAAAVKISGAGLGNDACNIHNEALYEEAMGQDVTFDQYHKWLERRLDGSPALAAAADRSTRKLSV